MQTLIIEGYLAADPSILSAQGSGKKRASFRVLETTRFRRGDGTSGERTTGFNCLCFNAATAEKYIAPFARKGTRVVVQGHVENDSWTGKTGVEHYDLRVIVDDIRLKNRRDANGGASAQAEQEEPLAVHEAGEGYTLDDDIPF